MVSCAAAASSCIQLDPAVLTKKLTIVAALAVSATAVYLLFGGTRNRSKNEEEAAEDRRDCAFSPDPSSSSSALSPEEDFTAAAAKEQFRDNIAMATEKPETVLHASSDHHQVLLEIVHEANTGPPRSSGQASLSPSSSSATRRLLLSSSPERACSGQACSGSTSRRLPSSERMCCSPATAAAATRLSPSRNPLLNTTTTRSVGVCTDPVGARGDQLELLRVVKREDIPPPSYDYLEMVSSTLEEDPAATSTCGKTNPQTSSSFCFFSSSCPPPFLLLPAAFGVVGFDHLFMIPGSKPLNFSEDFCLESSSSFCPPSPPSPSLSPSCCPFPFFLLFLSAALDVRNLINCFTVRGSKLLNFLEDFV